MNKATILLGFCLFFILTNGFSQAPISQDILGQNAWLINSNPGSDPNEFLVGHWRKVSNSGVKFVRIGGIGVNFSPLYSWDPSFTTVDVSRLKNLVDTIRFYGMEPIIEVGFNPICTSVPLSSNISQSDQAKIAGKVVAAMKAAYPANKRIMNWIISNEPDHKARCTSPKGGFKYDSIPHASLIASYVKEYAKNMKNADPDISIIAPEMAAFDGYVGYKVNELMNLLISDTSVSTSIMGKITDSGNPGHGKFYVDMISFHYYVYPSNRSDVINNLKGTNGFTDRVRNDQNGSNGLRGLVEMIENNSTGRNSSNLKLACTEFNIGITDTSLHEDNTAHKSVIIRGIDNRGFLAGQWLADIFSNAMEFVDSNNSPWIKFMTMWSIMEGDCNNNGLGYLSFCSGMEGTPRPNYWHYQLLAENIRGKFYRGIPTVTSGIKTFAGVDGAGFRIMILNQTESSFDYRVNFNNTSSTSLPNQTLAIKFNISGDPDLTLSSTGFNSTKTLEKRSTVVLYFDCHGEFKEALSKTYTEDDAVAGLAPHLKQIGGTDVDPTKVACGQSGGIGGTLTGNSTFTNTVIVNNDITLASNTKLTFENALVVFSPDVKITATPMASIEIRNSKLVGCDGKTWKGIQLLGNFHNNERLTVEDSYILNAETAIKADRIPNLKINNSILADGKTAIELTRTEAFSITNNFIAGFETGIITSETKPDFESKISDNRFQYVDVGLKFKDDKHTKLDIICNDFVYRDKAILSRSTDLKNQGSLTESAGNKFSRLTQGQPIHYVDHNGSATSYFYGPSETAEFAAPDIMNVTKLPAIADKVCSRPYAHDCDVMAISEKSGNASLNFNVYPNPNNGEFTIDLEDFTSESCTLTVRDILGKTIETYKIIKGQKNQKVSIQTPGIYLVSCESSQARATKKVIVE